MAASTIAVATDGLPVKSRAVTRSVDELRSRSRSYQYVSDVERSSGVGNLIWHTMMSLDGFIAGPNDDMQWAFGVDGGPSQTIEEVLRSTGALLVGRRTQDVEDRLQPGFYGGAFRGPFFVLRHDPPSEPPVVKGVTGRFLSGAITEAVTIAREAADGGDVVVLGANIAKQCID